MAFGTRAGGAHGAWLVPLFLLFGVLLPTRAVLWFMNEAARSQAESARQSVTEAYRGQLRLLRDRVNSFWEARATELDEPAGKGSAEDFQRAVSAGLADSVVYFDPEGRPVYPNSISPPRPDPAVNRVDWRRAQALEDHRDLAAAAAAYAGIVQSEVEPSLAARAEQARIRCLAQGGEKEAALGAIQEYFAAGRFSRSTDLQGRSIPADEQLLSLRLMKPADRRYAGAAKRLAALLNDYRAPMPSAQRVFLMEEMRAAFPTLAAERLAAQFLEADGGTSGDRGLAASRIRGVWKLPSKTGRAIALYQTETVMAAMRSLLAGQELGSVRFAMMAPGAANSDEAIAAGPLLPGWQISFALLDSTALDQAARRRMASYLWVGYVVIAAMTVTGLLVWQSFRRQWRLARLKTDLVSAVSHELRTPLASMRLLVDSLLEDDELDPGKTRDYLRLIAGENQRLTRLIENFLAFSRIERNRQRFDFTVVRPADVVESAVRLMGERFPEYRPEVDTGAALPALRADPDALVTVLLNLLDNAYKYTPGAKRIALRAYSEAGHVVFEVKDNGIGIAPREQRRIFRKFYQVDQRLARETGGCGLGLSIVEYIVRAHGGTVRVASQPGAGSTFRVRLPVQAESERAAA